MNNLKEQLAFEKKVAKQFINKKIPSGYLTYLKKTYSSSYKVEDLMIIMYGNREFLNKKLPEEDSLLLALTGIGKLVLTEFYERHRVAYNKKFNNNLYSLWTNRLL